MSRGKYSVRGYKKWPAGYEFKYNCLGEIPTPWDPTRPGEEFDSKTMLGGYDEEGFDSYGYSAFEYGEWAGHGQGVDREGYTEDDYLTNKDGGDV